MSFLHRYRTPILLFLVGALTGALIMQIRQGARSAIRPDELRVTEVVRAAEPLLSPEELATVDERFLFQEVARRVIPSVVFIEAEVDFEALDRDGESEQSWGGFMHPRVRTMGSGVVISPDGYILTNHHVVDGAHEQDITVSLNDKRTYPARLVGSDPSTDLAVLKVEGEGLTPVVVGNSDRVSVGDWVMAVGNPFRLRSTVTAGIVSALSRQVEIIEDALSVESFIQTDAAINRGNSGGALVNTSGQLIGVNTAIASQSGSYQGYGFAVPSNLALKVAMDLIEFGRPMRGMLGVSIASMTQEAASELGMDRIDGVLIVSIVEGGAATQGGLRVGDVITAVEGTRVAESNQLQERIALHRPGDRVALQVWRDGLETERLVTLGDAVALRERPRRGWFRPFRDSSPPDEQQTEDSARPDSVTGPSNPQEPLDPLEQQDPLDPQPR